jgi:hypothetical protein
MRIRHLLASILVSAAILAIPACTRAAKPSHAVESSTTSKPAATKAVQQVCLKETDPQSPRKSKLKGDKPTEEMIRLDVDGDGDPDILERWFHGKRCRWIDENDDMKWTDTQGDQANDVLQVDRDGDGYYDGPEDINIKWVDDDGDGRPDVEIFAANPKSDQARISSGTSHFMVFIDIDHDGVLGYIDWTTFEFNQANWRVPPTTSPTHLIPPPNFSPDYLGNSVFLKQHMPAWVVTDIRLNWENPFAFYDFLGNGCTQMSIRLLDTTTHDENKGDTTQPSYTYRGMDNESLSGWDLDGDAVKGNEMDYDMTFRFFSDAEGKKGERIDYTKYSDKHPKMKAPAWVLDGHYFRYDNWRRIEDFCYVTHDKCFEETWKTKWGSCWLCFDEDDDDHRWERVELYYPTEDPYSTKRWDAKKKGGLDGHGQSDTLGDRGEWDEDNSGRGQVYIGAWDQKIHLFGAESGAWSVDEHAKYWGSTPVLGNSSPEKAPKVEELVQYYDTDKNGFFDKITYDYDGDRTVDLTINLLDYRTAENPHPDVRPLNNPGAIKWQGMHELFAKISQQSFQDALKLYRALWKKGLTTPEMHNLSFASSTGDQYDHGYWLKEKIFRSLDKRLAKQPELQGQLRKAYFSGDYAGVMKIIDGLDPMPRVQ